MHLFKSSKYSPTKVAATTTVGGGVGNDGEGGLSSSGNGVEPAASTQARMKHKSMDMSFFPFSNFLTRSISRKVASSPERVPRRNEFDTPGFLTRSWSINKKLDQSLSLSKSVAKGENGNVWEADAETKPSHRRSQSTTRKNDWFGSFVSGGRDNGSWRGKSDGEGSGSSRSKSTAARRSYAGDGGNGSSRSGRPEVEDEEWSSSRSRTKPSHRRSQSTSRKNDWFGSFVGGGRDDGSSRGKSGGEGGGSSRSKSTTARRSYAGDGGSGSSRSGGPETDDEEGSSSSRSTARRRSESMSGPLPGGGSRRSSIPIMFSNSKGKPPPVERTLECTLEELLSGCVKKVPITRIVFCDG